MGSKVILIVNLISASTNQVYYESHLVIHSHLALLGGKRMGLFPWGYS